VKVDRIPQTQSAELLNGPSPPASVIVSTRNSRERLLACLDSLSSQTAAPGEFEVIVVDDGSTDGTTERLRSLTPPYRLNVAVQEAAGPAAARNAGANAARGSILIFLADAVVARPDLVAAHLDAHRRAEEIVVVGNVEQVVGPQADRFTRVRAEAWERQYRRLAGNDATFVDFHSGNSSLRAALFHAVCGYASDLPGSQDLELAHRLREAGARFVFAPAASVAEHRDDNWRTIADESRVRGRAAVGLYRRHPPLLPHMPLGGVGGPGPRKRRLQSLLMTFHISPGVLARLGELVPGRPGRGILDFTYDYGFWCGVRDVVDDELWRRLRSPTIILLYHAFTRPGERRSRYVVSARRFGGQLRWLKWRRYNVISLRSYLASRTEYLVPPARSVVITIDDGYADNVAVAKPILDRFGFPATVFVVTAAGQSNGWSPAEPALAERPLVPLSELPKVDGTFDFGAHTRSHVRLDEVGPALARSEILDSKRDLEQMLGTNVASFAYPYGAYDASARDVVREAGFSGACTVDIGANVPSTDSFELRRLEIRGGYSLLRFAFALGRADTRPLVPRPRNRSAGA
jgi:peptidoglycan/xylan/chitin deacetylase (PgdA/CDA1 family)